jgi:hypothetical protein
MLNITNIFAKISYVKNTEKGWIWIASQNACKKHWLVSGLLKDDLAVFRRVLHGMWFALYPRANRVKGSCAFEHVFLGEVKSGQVNGFHNWLFFLLVRLRNHELLFREWPNPF